MRQGDAVFAVVDLGRGLEECVFVLDGKVMFSCHFAGRPCLCFIMLPACVQLIAHYSASWRDCLKHGVFTLLNPHLEPYRFPWPALVILLIVHAVRHSDSLPHLVFLLHRAVTHSHLFLCCSGSIISLCGDSRSAVRATPPS